VLFYLSYIVSLSGLILENREKLAIGNDRQYKDTSEMILEKFFPQSNIL
jgi:hypothetical protein